MTWLTIGCILLIVCYIIGVLYLFSHWLSIPTLQEKTNTSVCKISVVIAVHNEEKHLRDLLECFKIQSLPVHQFEIIVINDHSTDDTQTILSAWQNENHQKIQIQVLNATGHGKKNALLQGIQIAAGEIILCTDGDCLVGREWLQTYASFFDRTKAQFVFGPICYNTRNEQVEKSLFYQFQLIELASLVGSGAACWHAQTPTMCNGANLAYVKSTFFELGGFEGNIHISSGDDEFLYHKFYKKFPDKTHFIKNTSALVYTQSNHTLGELREQRTRWASKWEHYTDRKVQFIALFVFLSNALTGFCLLYLLVGLFNFAMGNNWILIENEPLISFSMVALLCFRWWIEYLFLKDVLRFMDKKINLWAFAGLVLVYPFYVMYFGLAGRLKKKPY